MYLRTHEGVGQTELPSIYGTPCLQDDVLSRLEFALLSDSITKTLDDFYFRSFTLRTWHKTWIRRQFVPAIVASWRTSKPIRTIILVGDADEVGQPSFNYKLGKARAEAVGKELTKQIEDQSRGLSNKITIEVYSRGECWPVVKSGKKEMRNRRVEVFGVKAEPVPPPPPPPRAKTLDLRLTKETMKRIEEQDRQKAEQERLFPTKPIGPPTRGKSLSDWLDELLKGLPQRRRIRDAILKGSCSLLEDLFRRGGGTLSEKQKEDFRKQCRDAAQRPI